MIDRLFANRDLAENAVYKRKSDGVLTPLRVLRVQEDKFGSFGESKSLSSSTVFEIRSSDVSDPKIGDGISINEVLYTIQADPQRKADGLVWSLNVHDGG